MKRRVTTLFLPFLLFCLTSIAEENTSVPDLVVVISVDQMRADYLTRFAPWFSEDGFARLTREGATFPNATHRHSITLTAPGHATIGSGLDPHEHGIVANNWWNRDKDQREYCVFDPCVTVTAESTKKSSPWKLASRGLGDALKLHHRDSKVIGVAQKDRAAILMAGRNADAAYWFDENPGVFLSSSYYEPNPDVLAFNETLTAHIDSAKVWEPSGLIPRDDLERITFDPDSLIEHKRDRVGLGRSFPHPIGNHDAFMSTPLFDVVLVDLAMHIIKTERMGADDGHPDILFVGLSPLDHYGHDFGPDSKEVADGIVRLDREIARLLEFLDEEMKDRWTVAFTSDHGVQQIPEVALAQGKKAGRIDLSNPGNLAVTMSDLVPARLELERAIAREFDVPVQDDDPIGNAFIRRAEASGFYLNWGRVVDHGLDPEEVRRATRKGVLEIEGVRAAFTAGELLAPTPARSDAEELARRSFFAQRSPDVFVVLEPGYIFSSRTTGTTHGQANEADMRVPLILSGVGVKQGSWDHEVGPADLARSLGVILRVEAGAEDTVVLPCVLEKKEKR